MVMGLEAKNGLEDSEKIIILNLYFLLAMILAYDIIALNRGDTLKFRR